MVKQLREEMSAYLQEVIRDRSESDLQTTRDQIARCFGKVDCFLLPHPGPRVVRKNYNGAVSEMDPFFKVMVSVYVRSVLGCRQQPKVINGRALTARELQHFFDSYVAAFQNGDGGFPRAMTMLQATAEANNRNSKDIAIALYRRMMGALGTKEGVFVKESIFSEKETAARQASLEQFDSMATMGAESDIARHREQLVVELDAEMEARRQANAVSYLLSPLSCNGICSANEPLQGCGDVHHSTGSRRCLVGYCPGS